ncbi:MAG: YgiQ family radical SAM protein [Clostridia bacterium]|nr:YgiQ family radical SAM protein [Clostridia bacterium]
MDLTDYRKPLPMSVKELENMFGVTTPDFVIVSGDAYIDHPSFGTAIIGRVLASRGYSVGIIAQPDWHSAEGFKVFGRPRLAFLVNAGNMDSMVNHYTSSQKRRGADNYSPGGKMGLRPDRAVTVYSNRVREAYGGVPLIIGGIETSLRRFAHYDYWDDKVRRSVLVDSGADILSYGMGERQTVELADALASGLSVRDITYIAGTCYMTGSLENVYEYEEIPSFEEVSKDKKAYCRAFMRQYEEQDAITGKRLVQKHGDRWLVANPPAMPLTTQEFDDVYELPYTRLPHPSYKEHIPAIDEVEFSLVSSRGCFGACSFCALTFHQGRVIQARSHESLIREAKLLTKLPNFKGYIHDVGGPTANFRRPACKKQLTKGACKNRACLGYEHCKNVEVDHRDYTELLRKLRAIPGVKKVFVRSGIRYDYLMFDKDDTFMRELIGYHVSGQLKVAPEHISDNVLRLMQKPAGGLYDRFCQKYMRLNKQMGMEQYIVPYFMSSHPGSTLDSAIELAEYLKKTGQRPEQVQDFYPTPGTLSTCMFYTGLDPRDMSPVYVPKDPKEKAMQRALMQYFMPYYRDTAREALIKAGREDLIGSGRDCLVPEARPHPKGTKPENGGGTKKSRAKKGDTATNRAKPTQMKDTKPRKKGR